MQTFYFKSGAMLLVFHFREINDTSNQQQHYVFMRSKAIRLILSLTYASLGSHPCAAVSNSNSFNSQILKRFFINYLQQYLYT